MYYKIAIYFLFQIECFCCALLFSQNNTDINYYQIAYEKIKTSLEKDSLFHFEDAIFTIENSFYNNQLSEIEFKNSLDFHTNRIILLANANKEKLKDIKSISSWAGINLQTEIEKEELNNQVLLNWAIYTYLTDTTYWKQNDGSYAPQYPMQYDTNDPFGVEHWENTLVTSLLNSKVQRGNCYSMAALFYIFSLRLQTDAYLTTAPYHIFIQHKGFDGNFYNIELTTKTFPGSGTIKTYTYSSHEAVKNGISMRRLNEKEAVSLCLVQLAKGFERKLSPFLREGVGGRTFMLACAEAALQYDSLCLNAMILKAQVLEQLIKSSETANNVK